MTVVVVELFQKTRAFLSVHTSQETSIASEATTFLSPPLMDRLTPPLINGTKSLPLSRVKVVEAKPILQGRPNSGGEAAFEEEMHGHFLLLAAKFA